VAYAELGNLKEARAALALAETEAQRSARRKELRQLDDKLRFGHSPADQTRFQELWRVEGDIQRGLEAIARALARKGDLSGAMAVVDELNQPARRLHLIKDVSMLHMQAGREDRTLRWARNLSRPSERVFALVGIATGLSHLTDKRKVKPAPSHKQAPLSP
jgi:hypothetical protein